MLRYRAEQRGPGDRVKVVDTETGLVGWYHQIGGDRIMADSAMPESLNDQAVLDQLYWLVP